MMLLLLLVLHTSLSSGESYHGRRLRTKVVDSIDIDLRYPVIVVMVTVVMVIVVIVTFHEKLLQQISSNPVSNCELQTLPVVGEELV